MEMPNTVGGRLVLVSCVKVKASYPLPAKDIYISSWFKKARGLIERSGLDWWVLSAEHGLLSPDAVIAPYERTLNRMSGQEKKKWAEKVMSQIEQQAIFADEVIVLAGDNYRRYLLDDLQARFGSVQIPMIGLPIGRQLNWLTHAKTL